MRTRQLKVGLHVVVKRPCAPVGRIVAGVALVTEAAAMWVVTSVAGSACRIHIVKSGGRMTPVTFEFAMCSHQRKVCNVMVEVQLRNPARGYVTGLATIPELTFVNIIGSVTGSAAVRRSAAKTVGMAIVAKQITVARR